MFVPYLSGGKDSPRGAGAAPMLEILRDFMVLQSSLLILVITLTSGSVLRLRVRQQFCLQIGARKEERSWLGLSWEDLHLGPRRAGRRGIPRRLRRQPGRGRRLEELIQLPPSQDHQVTKCQSECYERTENLEKALQCRWTHHDCSAREGSNHLWSWEGKG